MAYLLYTVQSADMLYGLEGIAQRLYGDTRRWAAIYEASRYLLGNNPTVLRAGQQLIVPEPNPFDDGGAARVYVVEPLDSLEGLAGVAQRVYGSPERWPEIYALNAGTVGADPLALQPGQRLILPR
jgi:nucleoid-associated protein YgaU